MSLARPARGALVRCLASTRTAAAPLAPCHAFHSSAPRSKRRPRFRNVKAQEMGLLDPETLAKYQQDKFPEYTTEELAELQKKYTPEQLESLKAGETAVDAKDIILQGRLRDDAYRPEYIEDYTVLDPRYDVKPPVEGKPPHEMKWLSSDEWVDNYGMKMTKLLNAKTDKQLTRAMVRALRKVKQDVGQELIDFTEDELKEMDSNPELLQKYLVDDDAAEPDDVLDPKSPNVMTREQAMKLDQAVDAAWKQELETLEEFGNDAETAPTPVELLEGTAAGVDGLNTVYQPELGKVPGVQGLFRTTDSAEEGDSAGQYDEIKRVTGLTLEELKSIYTRGLVSRFVHNQTRLGKIRSISMLSVAGNGDGRLGIGMAKSTSPEVAMLTSRMLALRNMKPIRRYENRTVYGDIKAKVSGTVVELFARPPGFGLRVPHRIFEMCRACGIHDISARMPRSKNPMNSVKATYKALTEQPDPEAMAIGRGKKLVDVRKVYYGGSVH